MANVNLVSVIKESHLDSVESRQSSGNNINSESRYSAMSLWK